MNLKEKISKLVEEGYMYQNQQEEFEEYQQKNIFSLNSELLFFMYASVLLFTSGVGVVIYKNIDSIGHSIILIVNFLLALACFYFCFKKAHGFSKKETSFENAVYDYLVLLGTILSCIFVGYFQFQYQIFGNDYRWVSLVSALICFSIAYYFDQKMVLSMAITSLIAFVGITLTPQTFLENEVYDNANLSYCGIGLSIILLLWTYFAQQQELKSHFSFVYYTFVQHLSGVCIIAGLINDYWYSFIFICAAMTYYFYKLSMQLKETSLYIFTLVYGYIGVNIFIIRLIEKTDLLDAFVFLSMLTPFYFIASIVLFIKAIKKFNKSKYASIQ
jgi:hypothetical protein